MSPEAFYNLVNLLLPNISLSDAHATSSTGGHTAIPPEVIVANGIRFMSGDPIRTLSHLWRISPASCHRIIELFLDAVMACPQLEIRLPETPEEMSQAVEEWHALSTANGALHGFIGALDGWLAYINKPTLQDVSGNQADYWSGHYNVNGLNVQAMCDARLRFIYFTIAAPGSTGDARAFARCNELVKWIQNLPNGYFVGGDNAYPLSNGLLIPFSGSQRFEELTRTYNFFFSQLRIRIEMAFGRLTTKWRIFRSKMPFSLKKNIQICQVAARLHNYVIDHNDIEKLGPLSGTETMDQLRTIGGIDPFEDGDNLGFHHPVEESDGTSPTDEPAEENDMDTSQNDLPNEPTEENDMDTSQDDLPNESRRVTILGLVQDFELVRPDDNIARNDE
mmetsp:Transcript_24451/g.59867  ORF Transcript_24451/g.59867 Transcript_24451/m.59867 type:complete len:392 (-) Transcript_24451:73-1248(-)